ncbi:MAG: hypothetical protein ACOCZ6_03760 [Nanoarchaeota archaeon]
MSPVEEKEKSGDFESLCGMLDYFLCEMDKDEKNGRHYVETYGWYVEHYLRKIICYDKNEAQHRYNPLNLMARITSLSPRGSDYNKILNKELYRK